MASFSAKIGCKMPWKRENKNTILKLWHPIKPKQVGKGREREKIKIIVPLRSYSTRNREFQKYRKKLKKFKNTIMASFQAKNRLEKEGQEIKWKLSLRFVPSRRVIQNSKKIAIKFKKLKYTIMASFQAKIGW